MSNENALGFEEGLAGLRALAEPTRLRLALLLQNNELNVSDLCEILGQSQPRISRHLKLMQEARLLERVREGAYAFYRLKKGVLHSLLIHFKQDDELLLKDIEQLTRLRQIQEVKAQSWFANHARDWDKLRALHVSEGEVEAAMLKFLPLNYDNFLDLGTGTGRILELFAPQYKQALGIDSSSEMLGLARSALAKKGLTHVNLRLGDLYRLELPHSFNAIVLHQVLHFLDDVPRILQQAALALSPQGQLLIVDFAPHEQEFLREEHAHRRLGFASETMQHYLTQAGLKLEKFDNLKPHTKGQLTVSLWLATRK